MNCPRQDYALILTSLSGQERCTFAIKIAGDDKIASELNMLHKAACHSVLRHDVFQDGVIMPFASKPDFTDREFMLWLAEAVEHIDHLLVSIRNLLIALLVLPLVLILLWWLFQ
jgi:hypothetical protein